MRLISKIKSGSDWLHTLIQPIGARLNLKDLVGLISIMMLPVETELDKLRDVLPRDAKDQLYGVTKLEEAWSILTKRYGDKMLLSKKLKNQLKGIQSEGRSDPEKVINLKIKVRNIVTRL